MTTFSGYTGEKLREADYIISVVEEEITDYLNTMVTKDGAVFLLVGPMLTGKSAFLSAITNEYWRPAIFNRGAIVHDLDPSGMLMNAGPVFAALTKLEQAAMRSVVGQGCPVFKECRGSTKASRSIEGVDNSNIHLLVFDAPEEVLYLRAIHHRDFEYETEQSISRKIRESRSTFNWPTHSEGFRSIQYISTEPIVDQFLLNTVHARKA